MVGGFYQTPQGPSYSTAETDSSTHDASLHPSPLDFLYNAVQTFTLPTGQEVIIDRRSYMVDRNEQPLQYEVDTSGVPM